MDQKQLKLVNKFFFFGRDKGLVYVILFVVTQGPT